MQYVVFWFETDAFSGMSDRVWRDFRDAGVAHNFMMVRHRDKLPATMELISDCPWHPGWGAFQTSIRAEQRKPLPPFNPIPL